MEDRRLTIPAWMAQVAGVIEKYPDTEAFLVDHINRALRRVRQLRPERGNYIPELAFIPCRPSPASSTRPDPPPRSNVILFPGGR